MKYNEREYFQHQCVSVNVRRKSNVMNIFHIISHEVIQRGTQISWLGTASHNFLLNVKKIQKKSLSCVAKNATGQRRYSHAVVSSWAIKHLDFQKLAALWLARLTNNHVRIYGSNAAEGFSAFQRRSCIYLNVFICCVAQPGCILIYSEIWCFDTDIFQSKFLNMANVTIEICANAKSRPSLWHKNNIASKQYIYGHAIIWHCWQVFSIYKNNRDQALIPGEPRISFQHFKNQHRESITLQSICQIVRK